MIVQRRVQFRNRREARINGKKLRSNRLTESYSELLRKGRKNRGSAITPSELKSQVSKVAR